MLKHDGIFLCSEPTRCCCFSSASGENLTCAANGFGSFFKKQLADPLFCFSRCVRWYWWTILFQSVLKTNGASFGSLRLLIDEPWSKHCVWNDDARHPIFRDTVLTRFEGEMLLPLSNLAQDRFPTTLEHSLAMVMPSLAKLGHRPHENEQKEKREWT